MIPFDWNVVVAGAWNPAILTPAGIATRMFGLPDGSAVEVLVRIDGLGAPRVIHNGIVVTVAPDRLVVAPNECRKETLDAAAKAASRAIESLAETPLTAAGVNVRFQFDRLPGALISGLDSSLDDVLKEKYEVLTRRLQRSINRAPGVLNLEIDEQDAAGTVKMNFHLQSTNGKQLREWLDQTGSFVDKAEALLKLLEEPR